MKTSENELAEWMRQQSPLTEYSKTICNEANPESGAGDQPSNGQGQPQQPEDPFAGIDFDELPDNIRETLTKAKQSYTTQTQETAKLNDKFTQLENFARAQQSRADKLDSVVKRHNLDDTGRPPQPNPADPTTDPTFKDYVVHFTSQGLDKTQAETMAKLFVGAAQIQGKQFMGAVNQHIQPLVQTVGNVHADRVLQQFTAAETDGIMQIPEVLKGVRDSVAAVVGNGQTLTPEILHNLKFMEYGRYMQSNPAGRPLQGQTPQPGMVPSGGYTVPQNFQRATGPVPANEDTAKAAAGVAAAMFALVGKKKV